MGYQKCKYDAMLPIALDGGAMGVSALTDNDKILELRENLINGLIREGWNSSDAEDWAHDILELAIRYRGQLRNPESFMGWLKAIKINLLRNRYKRRKKEEEALSEAGAIDLYNHRHFASPERDYNDRLGVPSEAFYEAHSSNGLNNLADSLFKELPSLFEDLGERMTKVFISRIILGFSTKETMRLLDASENVIKKDLMKAMGRIKKAGLASLAMASSHDGEELF